jgi:hypothetical protein
MAIDRMYESEATKFLQGLMKDKPHLAEEQRKGRAMWWDKKLDADELLRRGASKIEQRPYVYQSDLGTGEER